MNSSKGHDQWRQIFGILAAAVFTFSLALRGAPSERRSVARSDRADKAVTPVTSLDPGQKIKIGPGVPSNLRVLPPVVVDYRNDPTSRSLASGEPVFLGRSSVVGGTVATPGAPCRIDAECDDCNPCTMDSCATSMCSGGEHDGDACEDDSDCAGACHWAEANPAEGKFCWSFLDCCGPPGGPHGDCVLYTCEALAFEQCVNWKIPYRCKDGDRAGRVCDPAQPLATECPNGTACNPGFEAESECDDELECNGQETCLCDPSFDVCESGNCQAGTPLCADQPGTVCDEGNDACVPPCTEDWHCDQDGLNCTVDLCDLDGSVTGTAGQCYVVNPCGPGGECTEGDPVVCNPGRCCDADGACTAVIYDECETAAGAWLATEDACVDIGQTENTNDCPAYASGIAPQGDFITGVGEVTWATQCPGFTFQRLGDDYTVDPEVSSGSYINVEIVRFAASVQVQARMAIEFWDISNPANPLFIEDTFYPPLSDQGVSDAAVHTLLFDPPLTIPSSGVMAISVAANFTPLGAYSWLSTDVEDVGTNSPTTLFVQGPLDALPAVDTSGLLGVCDGGYREGLWCDMGGTSQCPDANCIDKPDVLAFEIVGTSAGAPDGACCDAELGTCSKVLPWVCEDANNVFQGVGTGCQVCQWDPLGPECNDDLPDCQRCADDTEKTCVDTADCIAQGVAGPCEYYGPCVMVPPACQIKGCCDPATGDCVEVQKPSPEEPAVCPDGFSDLLYGSYCEGDLKKRPNCCPQPSLSGGDNCLDVTPKVVTVPAIGENPIQVTMTGNNSSATFDDYTAPRFCQDGVNDGEPCDVNADCPGGGVCNTDTLLCEGGSNEGNACDPNRDCLDTVDTDNGTCSGITCGGGIFNPEGDTRDPGWWEAFSLTDCANIRIETCCSEIEDPATGPAPVRPAWAGLYVGCPCAQVLSQTGVPSPIGEGLGTAGHARGGPYCPTDDNSWGTYGPLPAGTYYYPIYSGWRGTYSVENGGGTYQFHVTAGACPIAACCGEVCVDGDRDGLLCNPEGIPECPNGECVGGVCVNGDLAGYACDSGTGEVIQCPGGTCGEDTGCDVVNQLVCEAFGGFWLAGLNLPVNSPVEAIVNCGSGTELDPYICDTGACCVNPGDCRDDDGTGGPMDEELCETTLGGEYVGGSGCYDPEDPDNGWVPPEGPCPVCPAANYPENCQGEDGLCSYIFVMDRQNFGIRVADDFVARVAEITQFCFAPCYIRYNEDGYLGECYHESQNMAPPPDDFEIRFYEDNNGFPGDELPSSPGPVDIAAKAWWGDNFRCWDYAVMFSPPITGFIEGNRYWVEFSGAGSPPPPEGTGCTTFLHGSLEGNGWALSENDHFGGLGWGPEDILGRHEIADGTTDEYGTDFSFCIDGGLEIPPPVIGACCPCNGECAEGVPYEECISWYVTDANIDETVEETEAIGVYYPQQFCADITCEDIGAAGGGCPGEPSGIEGEDCHNPLLIAEGSTEFSNICSTTDGVGSYPHCDNQDNLQITADQWFEYHSCGSEKRIDIDVCGVNFDAVLAVYSNGTDTCPKPETKLCEGGTNPGIECTNDEECLGGGLCSGYLCSDGSLEQYLLPAPNGLCFDEECSFTAGDATMSTFAAIDSQCFLIRVGGYAGPYDANDRFGQGELEVACGGCFPSSDAVVDRLWIEGDSPPDPINQKIRVLSFSAGDPQRQQAIRVNFHQIPVPYDTWEGLDMWVGPLEVYCENSGQSTPPPAGCGFPGKDLPLEFAAATLQCDPYWNDWNRRYCLAGSNEGETCVSSADCGGHTCWDGIIHVYHEGIVPSAKGGIPAQYDIDVVEVGCIQMAPEDFSTFIRLEQSIWGDCVKDTSTQPARPPDGSIGVTTDVTGVLDKFKNISNRQPLTSVRSDVAPKTMDMKVGISDDVTLVLDAFKGANYPPPPFGDPSDPPCGY